VIRLAYFSSIAPAGRPSTRAILTASRRNNQQFGITGMAHSHKGDYLQILEGPTEPVLRVFAAIAKDRATRASRRFFANPISSLSFPDISMGFYRSRQHGRARRRFREVSAGTLRSGALQPSGALALFDLFRPARPPDAALSQAIRQGHADRNANAPRRRGRRSRTHRPTGGFDTG